MVQQLQRVMAAPAVLAALVAAPAVVVRPVQAATRVMVAVGLHPLLWPITVVAQ